MKDAKGHGSDARTIAAMHNIPTGHLGAFKVQALDTKLAGNSWGTVKRYGNRAVAERVAQHMRTDGGFTRVR